MFSQNGDLRFTSSSKSRSIHKFNGFATKGFLVFTYFTDQVGPLKNLININISVI